MFRNAWQNIISAADIDAFMDLDILTTAFVVTYVRLHLALQLPFPKISESMGNHDSKIVDAGSVD
jgi:hypothetical protein